MTDSIPLIPPVPPGLKESAQRGTLIPFVGAGVSRLAGCPNWPEFADRALRSFVAGGKFSFGQLAQIGHLNPRVKLSIAQGLEAEHKLPINFDEILKPQGGYENDIGRKIYGGLAKLGQTFVTTNYDEWLDTEIATPKPTVAVPTQQVSAPTTPSKRTVYYHPRDFIPANLNQPKTVFHLHGSLRDPDTMVITTRDYIMRYANDRQSDDPQKENRTLTFLDHLFREKTVLFIGYGVEELEILEYVIQKARLMPDSAQTEAKHFMLQGFFSHEFELMRSLTQYYKQCDIQLLPFLRDQRDWHQLAEVIESYSQSIPASEPMRLQKMYEMEKFLDDEA